MRVLLAITKGEVGGAQEYVRVVATGLVERNHDVGVMVAPESPLADAASQLGARVFPWRSIRRNPNPLLDVQARRELGAAVASWQPDVLHLNSSKAGVLGVRVLRPPRGVTIFTCHHAPFGPGRALSHRMVGRPIEQVMLPRLDGIISVGVRDMPLLAKIAPEVPLRHIPNGVPEVTAQPVALGPLRPHALWVARMARPKDPELAVRAWEHVAAEVPGARLVMCGTGPLEDRVRRLVESSPFREAIDVRGFVDDLQSLQAEASLFILCSRVEGGLTMATLEAMSQGLVPVVTDAGDAFKLEHEGTGIWAPERDARRIAARILALLRDPTRFDELRRHALVYARNQRTPSELVDETVDFYEEVRRLKGCQ